MDLQQWQQKQAWLSSLISLADADVMAFQEVFSAEELAEQCKSLGYPYFLSTPSSLDESSYVYRKPGLALASKYPLRSGALYNPAHLDIFSRAPLVAKVKLPEIGWIKIYVAHLKSKRPILDEDLVGEPSDIDEYMGRWQSDTLRAKEVSLLMQDILSCRKHTLEAVMVMGDFNDDISQGALSHIFDLPLARHDEIEQAWRMHDSFALSQTNQLRAPTHYWGGQGSVLDYILLSGEFSNDYQQQMAEVVAYHCFDRHLTHADYAIDSQASDHAAVMVELKAWA
ncbi:endonuclease/exonuclease/phosphatase family protein [Agarivorans aestuarii]|uniref:Endonuclease/exonuclease/phosphatase family protein n=1 Tax=Agarivorans aestuarii TaxID=1563703 RepID=A0ABU7G341_9ALTE|nr:endonuclease/exonuclease/phosphatase family protein [Agarivorans aestuarii]MEE1673797.1 endonuclease/exonuclease/phosphatase family protein [Agarivorans aestuarii]